MKFISHQQGSQEWLDYRKRGVGASDVGIILGLHFKKSPYMLWQEKLNLVTPPDPTAAMRRGSMLEDDARREYTRIMGGCTVAPAVVQSSNHSWAFASLDGISPDHDHIVEIKCPGPEGHAESKNGNIKPVYIAQMNWQMFVTGLNKCDYFSYDGESGYIHTIERDDDLIAAIVEKAKEFMHCLINIAHPEYSELDFDDKSNDAYWENLSARYAAQLVFLKAAESNCADLKQQIIDYSGGRNCRGTKIQMTKYSVQGRIQYKNIPEIQGLDLEKYRSKSSDAYRITIRGEENDKNS